MAVVPGASCIARNNLSGFVWPSTSLGEEMLDGADELLLIFNSGWDFRAWSFL